jgi:hypothetical protein
MDSMSKETKPFSLICVSKVNSNGTVDGSWMKDHYGTVESAYKAAKETEAANSNRISVAVVAKLPGSTPNYDPMTNLKIIKNTEPIAD